MSYLPIGKDDGNHNVVGNPDMELREQDRWLPIANVARLMKGTLPTTAKVSKDAKECMQECVSEFILFITSEASDKCLREKRKTINGEDILYLLHDLGFENYAEVLKIYLAKYREQQAMRQERGETRLARKSAKRPKPELDAEDDGSQTFDQNYPADYASDHNSFSAERQDYDRQPYREDKFENRPKDLQSPDYFDNYPAEQTMAQPELHDNIPLDKGYRYGTFIAEDAEATKKP